MLFFLVAVPAAMFVLAFLSLIAWTPRWRFMSWFVFVPWCLLGALCAIAPLGVLVQLVRIALSGWAAMRFG